VESETEIAETLFSLGQNIVLVLNEGEAVAADGTKYWLFSYICTQGVNF